ncbi:DUF2845 domain-containing protein [Salinicola lusitanus]|uniref:DUF2845 domain-containing protein n=1 Tax=Salinicola lusitanus TaxID=1949085 RepID=A0ABZ3CR83_9GAMM
MRGGRQASSIGLVILSLSVANPVIAMRCQGGLTANGDTPEQVLQKCGAPASRVIELPQRRGGHLIEGAVRVERWVYGPRHGARYPLRFVAGKRVDERLELSP